ncbi:MAG: PQQ-binding-like beta-propeller repeat protein [Candidatus Anammoximicrobium sp.]|nr:PQQ-binding-like beta-propeller repeat protein [Candidatus Anammoximicrobium sp.]
MMRTLLCCLFCAAGLPCFTTPCAPAQEWTRFRGPNGQGHSDATNLPERWTEADLNWKAALPGQGHSSPVLWGDKIFLMSAEPKTATRYVLCLSATDGRELWRRQYASQTHRIHMRNTYGSSTPAVDAERVYIAWSTPARLTLLALDHDGRDVWKRDLGPVVSEHGFGTSPMLYQDMVILSNSQQAEELEPGQQPGRSAMLALEAKTGQLRWSEPRVSSRVCFSTPCIYEPAGGPPELICTSTSDGIFSLNPLTGKENWKSPGTLTMRVVNSPLVTEGLIIGSVGSGGGGNYIAAVRPGQTPQTAYIVKKSASYVPTLVAKDGLLFMFNDKGVVSCLELQTGEPIWQERVSRGFSGSPVLADDKLYIIDDEGTVHVLAASSQYRLLSSNPLGEPSRSTPAIAGGRLYLRTVSHLVSVGGNKP